MAKTKREKIAGKSYDDFLKITQDDLAVEIQPKSYSNKLIAFLDLLGIKDLIDKYSDGNEHEAIEIIENMRKIAADSCDFFNKSDYTFDHTSDHTIENLLISDSFVFICEPNAVSAFIDLLATVQTRVMIECHFLLRGAVTIGDAIVREDGKFIIGPAYIKAYLMQEKSANYPRVIVDSSVTDQLSKNGHPLDHFLSQDTDKEYFVDYLKVYMRFEPTRKTDMKIKLRTEGVLNHISSEYKKYYYENNHNISQKYGWTMQYFKNTGVWENAS